MNANVATVLWGDSLPKLATQGVTMQVPLRVYSPTDRHRSPGAHRDQPRRRRATTDVVEALAAGEVKIYGATQREPTWWPCR